MNYLSTLPAVWEKRLFKRITTVVIIASLSTQLLACTAVEAQPQMTVEALATQIKAAQIIPTDGPSDDATTLPLILDVRTAEEYAAGHIPQAINIDHRQVAAQIDTLRPFEHRNVVVYCERGARARAAEKVLTDAGFSAVIQLNGHMRAWRAAELPIETD